MKKEGLEEGKIVGLEIGKQNGKESASFEIVKNLLNNSINPYIISKSTGLSIEEINEIKNDIK